MFFFFYIDGQSSDTNTPGNEKKTRIRCLFCIMLTSIFVKILLKKRWNSIIVENNTGINILKGRQILQINRTVPSAGIE